MQNTKNKQIISKQDNLLSFLKFNLKERLEILHVDFLYLSNLERQFICLTLGRIV